MPTYEYACKACDHNFDIVQSFSEDTLTTCPECGQDALRKVYNAAGIIFKGDGWHIKDYASSGSSSSTAPGTGEGSTSTEGDSTTGDSGQKSDSSSTSKATGGKQGGKKGGGSGSGTATAKPAAG